MEESSSESLDIQSQYQKITDWASVEHGVLINYTFNTKRAKIHRGWFYSYDTEKQNIEIYVNAGKISKVPLDYIREAWYHPDLIKEDLTLQKNQLGCCVLI